jgi:hypothetical protein
MTTTIPTTVMTDKQFALQKALEVYTTNLQKGMCGTSATFYKTGGVMKPEKDQIGGILELANIFEEHLKK